MTRYSLNILGEYLTGIDGSSDRSYTLPFYDINLKNMTIFVSGTYYNYGTDYKLNGAVLTFINEVFNDQIIQGVYFYTKL